VGQSSNIGPREQRHFEEAFWSGGSLKWEWNPNKGRSGTLLVNGVQFDLADGQLFLIRTEGGQVRVAQLQRDLSGINSKHPDFESMAKQDADVAQFVAEASRP
jgi:hypothetical protein